MRYWHVSFTNAVVFLTAVLPVAAANQYGAESNGKVPKVPKVAFFSISALGHLQPLLSLAEEMGQRGWDALVVTTEEAENYVTSSALRNATLEVMLCDRVWERGMDELREELLQNDINSITLSNDWSIRWLTESRIWDCLYERGLDILEKHQVDLMVIDVLTFAGFDIAEKLNVNYVVNHAIVPEFFAPMPEQSNALPMLLSGNSMNDVSSVTLLLQRMLLPFLRPILAIYSKHKIHWPLDRKRAKFGLSAKDQFDIHRNRLILVEHVLGVEYSRPIHPLMHFVGHFERKASVEPPLNSAESDWLGEQPVIYVSFGTVFRLNKERANVLLEGLSSDRFRVLWSLKSFGELNQSLSSNVRIAPWVSSQLRILGHPNVHAFISHCGDNSLYESIKMGTPLLCIPIGLDQLDCAMRGFDAGVARVLDKQSFTPEDIHREIQYILQKQSQFQSSLRRAQDLLKLAGGVTRAADLVEHVHTFGTERLNVHSGYTLCEMFNLDVLFIQFSILALIVLCWPRCRCGCCKSGQPKIEKTD